MTFHHWLDTLIDEKGIDLEQRFLVSGPSGLNSMELQHVVDAIKQTSPAEQFKIKKILVQIDFYNGDVTDYFKHFAQAIVR